MKIFDYWEHLETWEQVNRDHKRHCPAIDLALQLTLPLEPLLLRMVPEGGLSQVNVILRQGCSWERSLLGFTPGPGVFTQIAEKPVN